MRALLSLFVLSVGALAASDFDSLIKQGRAAFLASDLASAQTAYTEACPAEKMAAFPLQRIALCEHSLGTVAEASEHGDEAASRYFKSLAAFEQLGPPYVAHAVATLTNLGALYRRQQRLSDAERVLARALDLAREAAATDPESYAITLSRAGALAIDLNQPERARNLLGEAIAGFRASPRPNTPELAYAFSSLGMMDIGSGQYKTAESNFREAVTLAAGSLGETDSATAAYSTNLALALLMQGQFNRAETLLNRARFIVESRLGPDNIQLARVFTELTSVETALGRFRLAEDDGKRSLSILNSHAPAGSLEIVLAQVALGSLYVREHDVADAEKILPAAVAMERGLLKDGKILADGIRDLAGLKAQQHAWNDAESLYREAIGLYERKLGADHSDIAPVLRAYSDVLKHQSTRGAEVRDIEARARAIEKSIEKSAGRAQGS
jgi:tetratricopeptide (TPR) repeat protein